MIKNVLLLMFILSCNNEETGQTFNIVKKDTFFIIAHDTFSIIKKDTVLSTIFIHDTIIKIKTDTFPRFKLLDTAFFHQLNDSTIEIKINNSTITMRDVKD